MTRAAQPARTGPSAPAGSAALRADPLAAPPRRDVGILAVALVSLSTSGPLIAATAAPLLAVAMWRNVLSTAVLLPWALGRGRRELVGLDRSQVRGALLAGALLAAHFATWVPSLGLTSVASATALVATQPVWAALIARASGQRLSRGGWLGIAIAVAGAATLGGVDFRLSARALAGDGLALAGAVFAAGYVTAGAAVRRRVSTTGYTSVCYATAGALLLGGCLAGRVPLTGYPAGAWWRILALTAGAQLAGHSLLNAVLRTTSPTVVSLAILLEVPGAAALAAVFLHQQVRLAQLPAAVLLGVGLAVVIRAGGRAVPAE